MEEEEVEGLGWTGKIQRLRQSLTEAWVGAREPQVQPAPLNRRQTREVEGRLREEMNEA